MWTATNDHESIWKWEVISMDLITGLAKTVKQHDSIMVIVDRLTKVSHFIPVKSTLFASNVAQVFIRDEVTLQGVAKKIVYVSSCLQVWAWSWLSVQLIIRRQMDRHRGLTYS